MIEKQAKGAEEKLGYLNIIVIVLSVYVLAALFISTFFSMPDEFSRLLDIIDNGICGFFLFEFVIRFYRADSKLQFIRWGWIDLLSSIPTVDFLRAGRTFRFIRLLRVLRMFRSARHLVQHIFRKRTQGAFTTVSVISILMVIFSAIAILQVEDDPNSNIKTAEDAIWWAYVTIATSSYGELYPVTTEGRIIAAFLMITGVGLFGTFTGFVASWFVENNKEEEDVGGTNLASSNEEEEAFNVNG